MATAFDVPASRLIPKIAEELKKLETIEPPEWAAFVKTGRHREKSPVDDDWWYTRSAAVLRKLYVEGPMGSDQAGSGVRRQGGQGLEAEQGGQGLQVDFQGDGPAAGEEPADTEAEGRRQGSQLQGQEDWSTTCRLRF